VSTTDRREQVRDSARYLRAVRPLDPEELADYVEGQPHPAVVRQDLRALSYELAIVEREDGTFVPVDEVPVAVGYDGGFPPERERAVADLLVERIGPDWHRGETGERLRERIRRLKADYYRSRPVDYDADVALAYAVYHQPDAYAMAAHAFADLGRWGLLGQRLRVLDVGAGTGGPAAALFDLLPDDALVEYHAVEPSAAADVLEALVDPGRNRRLHLHRETAEAFDPREPLGATGGDDTAGSDGPDADGDDCPPGYDLVVFSSVLSELDEPAATARRLLAAMAPDGTALLVSPADRETAAGLRRVERALESPDGRGYTVFAPEVRIWRADDGRPRFDTGEDLPAPLSPRDEGWSFVVRPDLDVPAFQRKLDDPAGSTGESVNADVQYAFSVLRADGRERVEAAPDGSRCAPLADAGAHVTDRVNVLAFKLSADLGEGDGHNPLFRIGDGSQQADQYAVLTRETSLNRPLAAADYGRLLAFEGVLVLWNDDERAYNLVVDEETIVDPVA
jgi:SAM-dependent methyltransferase